MATVVTTTTGLEVSVGFTFAHVDHLGDRWRGYTVEVEKMGPKRSLLRTVTPNGATYERRWIPTESLAAYVDRDAMIRELEAAGVDVPLLFSSIPGADNVSTWIDAVELITLATELRRRSALEVPTAAEVAQEAAAVMAPVWERFHRNRTRPIPPGTRGAHSWRSDFTVRNETVNRRGADDVVTGWFEGRDESIGGRVFAGLHVGVNWVPRECVRRYFEREAAARGLENWAYRAVSRPVRFHADGSVRIGKLPPLAQLVELHGGITRRKLEFLGASWPELSDLEKEIAALLELDVDLVRALLAGLSSSLPVEVVTERPLVGMDVIERRTHLVMIEELSLHRMVGSAVRGREYGFTFARSWEEIVEARTPSGSVEFVPAAARWEA